MKKVIAMFLAVLMVASLLAGCGSSNQPGTPATTPAQNGETPTAPVEEPALVEDLQDDSEKQAPMLQTMVDAGTLPALADRIPTAADVYVETKQSPSESPTYGGTIRTYENGIWYCGPITEEPLFRLLDDGTVEPNVAKGYDLSDDGLTYTIHLREGMKWSDGTPFTAEDCVYYYNYVLVTEVDNETGKVVKSNTTKKYNWYMSADPASDGMLRPAQVRYVDDVTFTITLYSPKPTMLQAIAIDNKWMFCPKTWYADIMAVNMDEPHWSGETDLKLIGGNDLVTITEEQAIANAAARNDRFVFEDYNSLCDQLGYRYWQYKDRPTLRPWVVNSERTDDTITWVRNAYYWKVDVSGRQLPYADEFDFVKMDASLRSQEIIAGNLDFGGFGSSEFPIFKTAEMNNGCFYIINMIAPNWSACALELNQGYKDLQYCELFANIDFRHALSIAADREEMNQILFNGMAVVSQFAAPEGTSSYIDGATTKWTEYDVDAANKLLDGIEMVSNELNADGYRTFVGGDNNGKAIVIEIETDASNATSVQACALLAQYYKKIGIQVVEVANTDNNARNEKLYVGDIAMSALGQSISLFNPMLRPDTVAANRNNTCWLGLYGLEHANHRDPVEGTPMYEVIDATIAMVAANTLEELQAATQRIVESHYENTWYIGYLQDSRSYGAINSKLHNVREGWVNCDELRFWGNTRPYTWFVVE